jgi:Tfp pilus assembly protein PilX
LDEIRSGGFVNRHTSRQARQRERGNSLVLAMIVLAALGTLSALTVVSVQSGLATTGNERFHTIAVYAAESGGAAAMDFLRKNVNLSTGWASYVSPNNASPPQPNLPGNNQQSGAAGNLFSPAIRGWYSVQIYNNHGDTGFATGADNDTRRDPLDRLRAQSCSPTTAVMCTS